MVAMKDGNGWERDVPEPLSWRRNTPEALGVGIVSCWKVPCRWHTVIVQVRTTNDGFRTTRDQRNRVNRLATQLEGGWMELIQRQQQQHNQSRTVQRTLLTSKLKVPSLLNLVAATRSPVSAAQRSIGSKRLRPDNKSEQRAGIESMGKR